MPLANLYAKTIALQVFDVKKETINIINENSEYLSSLLRKQLSEGKDGKGNPVTLKRRGGVFPYYSDRTVFEKERKGQNTQWVTNEDSGTFYSSLYVYASGNDFIFDSDVPYFADIIRQAGQGDEIIKLSKENLSLFKEQILEPQLILRFNSFYNGV